jgi:hypothetical protein
MNLYVQYHNVAYEGLRCSDPPFTANHLATHTRRPSVKVAEGRVFLIAGIGRPRRYFLWETFVIDTVKASRDRVLTCSGDGWQLSPPVELGGARFNKFKSACANFVGFRNITNLPFARTLHRFAERHRPPGVPEKVVKFFHTLDGLFEPDDPLREVVRTAMSHYQPVRALSIRHPSECQP